MKKFVSYLYIVLAGVYTTFFSIQNTFAEERRTITFSSGYLEKYYTNRQIANFGIELFEDMSFVFNSLSETINNKVDNNFFKYTISSLFSLLDLQFIFVFAISYHEFGHAIRHNASGNGYFLAKIIEEDRYDGVQITTNFFKYFLMELSVIL